jgi:hypothetical protein
MAPQGIVGDTERDRLIRLEEREKIREQNQKERDSDMKELIKTQFGEFGKRFDKLEGKVDSLEEGLGKVKERILFLWLGLGLVIVVVLVVSPAAGNIITQLLQTRV